jgi:hypothetical protein
MKIRGVEPLVGTYVSTREEAMRGTVEAQTPTGARDRILGGLRRRLAELEAWRDGAVKDVAKEAVRDEMARVGREMVELEWRWA